LSTGAVVKAVFNCWNVALHFLSHTNGVFALVRLWRGRAVPEKWLIKQQ
jgi:hypothetical protein